MVKSLLWCQWRVMQGCPKGFGGYVRLSYLGWDFGQPSRLAVRGIRCAALSTHELGWCCICQRSPRPGVQQICSLFAHGLVLQKMLHCTALLRQLWFYLGLRRYVWAFDGERKWRHSACNQYDLYIKGCNPLRQNCMRWTRRVKLLLAIWCGQLIGTAPTRLCNRVSLQAIPLWRNPHFSW